MLNSPLYSDSQDSFNAIVRNAARPPVIPNRGTSTAAPVPPPQPGPVYVPDALKGVSHFLGVPSHAVAGATDGVSSAGLTPVPSRPGQGNGPLGHAQISPALQGASYNLGMPSSDVAGATEGVSSAKLTPVPVHPSAVETARAWADKARAGDYVSPKVSGFLDSVKQQAASQGQPFVDDYKRYGPAGIIPNIGRTIAMVGKGWGDMARVADEGISGTINNAVGFVPPKPPVQPPQVAPQVAPTGRTLSNEELAAGVLGKNPHPHSGMGTPPIVDRPTVKSSAGPAGDTFWKNHGYESAQDWQNQRQLDQLKDIALNGGGRGNMTVVDFIRANRQQNAAQQALGQYFTAHTQDKDRVLHKQKLLDDKEYHGGLLDKAQDANMLKALQLEQEAQNDMYTRNRNGITDAMAVANFLNPLNPQKLDDSAKARSSLLENITRAAPEMNAAGYAAVPQDMTMGDWMTAHRINRDALTGAKAAQDHNSWFYDIPPSQSEDQAARYAKGFLDRARAGG